MEPTKKQLNQYLNYLTQKDFVEDFKKYFNNIQVNIIQTMESSDFIYDEDSNWEEFLNIKLDDILSVECETEKQYNDEGGYSPYIETISLKTNSGSFFCDYEWYESLYDDISDFAQYFYYHGIIRFDDVKPPFNVEILE